jgi:hypothetical protein
MLENFGLAFVFWTPCLLLEKKKAAKQKKITQHIQSITHIQFINFSQLSINICNMIPSSTLQHTSLNSFATIEPIVSLKKSSLINSISSGY